MSGEKAAMKNKMIQGAVATAVGALLSGQALATNGYMTHGFGPISKGMAGACVAMIENAMCAAHNPASLTFLDNRWEIGAALFSPDRGFQANDDYMTPPYASIPPGKYESDNDLFLIPHFAYSRKLDDVSSLGFILGGNGGMNTDYDRPVFQNFASPNMPAFYQASKPTGINMMQLFMGVSYGRLINEQHSLALMPIVAVQTFKAEGLEPFRGVSESPNHVTNNGTDVSWGGGARIGWLWKATDQLNVGASYQTKLWMTKFDDYKGLFAEQGNFDIPPILDLGFAYSFTPNWTASFNYQHVWYEDVKSLSNPHDLPMQPGVLGSDDGLGFGWQNQNVYKFGVSWKFSPDMTVRAGYSHADQVVPDAQALFNVLAPAVVQDHFTLGFSKTLASNNEVHLSVMYAPEEKVYGTNPNTGPQTGHIYMSQWDIELGWVFKL
jgi:long-chain fatty acid transport protein